MVPWTAFTSPRKVATRSASDHSSDCWAVISIGWVVSMLVVRSALCARAIPGPGWCRP
ncbi:hypothetical protein ACFQ4K_15565 [Tistrella bauzanensis]